jgi:hypothetical protein
MMADPTPTIVIDRDGDEYTINVEPAGVGDQFAAKWGKHGSAVSYARMISKSRDWPVDDRSGGAA